MAETLVFRPMQVYPVETGNFASIGATGRSAAAPPPVAGFLPLRIEIRTQ